jgi:hypothetical protein
MTLSLRRSTVRGSMPVLARGRHRRPARGACLMEYVSVLAGERFSDAPACTDPVLAAVARAVNDYSGDASRQRLAVMASDLTSARPTSVDAQQAMARRCLLTAIRYAVGDRRRVLIVAVLGLERAAAGQTRGFDDGVVGLDTELALLGCASDAAVARDQVAVLPVSVGQHRRQGIATAIELAAATIAQEATDSDDVLYDLLVGCLDDRGHADARPMAVPAWGYPPEETVA